MPNTSTKTSIVKIGSLAASLLSRDAAKTDPGFETFEEVINQAINANENMVYYIGEHGDVMVSVNLHSDEHRPQDAILVEASYEPANLKGFVMNESEIQVPLDLPESIQQGILRDEYEGRPLSALIGDALTGHDPILGEAKRDNDPQSLFSSGKVCVSHDLSYPLAIKRDHDFLHSLRDAMEAWQETS